MSYYISNYVFCDEAAKDYLTADDLYLYFGCYDKIVYSISENRFLVVFENRSEYMTEFITNFIQEYRCTRWYCVEEDQIEECYYYWNENNVEFSRRALVDGLEGNKELRIQYQDYYERPLQTVFVSDHEIVFENIFKNTMKRYYFNEKNRTQIMEWIILLLAKEIGDFPQYAIPLTDGIGRRIDMYWGKKHLAVFPFTEEDSWQNSVKDGKAVSDEMTNFFNSILHDEGIEDRITFSLKDVI